MRFFSKRETLIDPRAFQPVLGLPGNFDKASIQNTLVSVSIDGSPVGELRAYAEADCERFLHTLSLVDEGASGRLLEIGANPYFTTLLLRRFRPGVELSLANYFGEGFLQGQQTVSFDNFDDEAERVCLDYYNVNLESDALPFPDAHFEYVLFCEVLEHLISHPLRAVMEIKRVLRPGGTLILTTPNAARLENVIAFLEGRNMYDPYSAYGPYGRHNREYTRHELHMLMQHAGFSAETSYTANVHEDIPTRLAEPGQVNAIIRQQENRQHDLGQYVITRWRNTTPGDVKLPRWLYRSFPEQDFA